MGLAQYVNKSTNPQPLAQSNFGGPSQEITQLQLWK